MLVNGLRNDESNSGLQTDDQPNGSRRDQNELCSPIFSQPFNELLVWAVLTKRQSMAKLMWHHGEEALAKALVASKLYRAMAYEAADLEVEIYDELRGYSTEFERDALELLDFCHRQVFVSY